MVHLRRHAAAAACLLTTAGFAVAASAAAPGAKTKVVRARWTLMGVGAHHRALRALYLVGGCLDGDGWARVHQTPQAIRISVFQHETIPASGICPLDLGFDPLTVHLAGPVRGRRIHGWSRVAAHALRPGVGRAVPRVTGLCAADASQVLEVQRFRARYETRRHGKVVRQRPHPRHRLPPHRSVRLWTRSTTKHRA